MTRGKRRSRNRGPGLLFGLALIAAAVFVGLFFYAKYGPQAQEAIGTPSVQTPTKPDLQTVTVPVASSSGGDVKISTRTVSLPRGTDPVVAAVNAFLEESRIAPSDARLKTVTYQGSNALLEFSAAFRTTYGTDDEATLVRGIMRAVAENSKAKTATFLEGGKTIDSLGSIGLREPQRITDWLAPSEG